jgi:hypothetical protein
MLFKPRIAWRWPRCGYDKAAAGRRDFTDDGERCPRQDRGDRLGCGH